MEKRDIEMIKVVQHDNIHLYSLDNRRLAVFRLLQMVGKVDKIKARLVPKPQAEWIRKFDTRNNGISVKVRGPRNYVVGCSAATTTFPISSIRNCTKFEYALVGKARPEALAVEDLLDNLDSGSE